MLRLENLTLNVPQLTVQLLSCNPPMSWFSFIDWISKYAQFHSITSPSSGTNDKSIRDCRKIWKSAFCCSSGPNSSLFQSKSAASTKQANLTPSFHFLKGDRDNPLQTQFGQGISRVSDYSNVPYDNMQYQYINDVGKQWIRKYGLALSKELLGMVRSKYGSIPVPNAETTLDGDTLRGEATTE